jgi:hypothetical protein
MVELVLHQQSTPIPTQEAAEAVQTMPQKLEALAVLEVAVKDVLQAMVRLLVQLTPAAVAAVEKRLHLDLTAVTAAQVLSSSKCPDTITATFSAGVTQTSATAGGFTTYTVTATSTTSESVQFS